MAGHGHVKISRKAYATDPWWNEPREFSKWEAWEDCIQMAAWKPRSFVIGHSIEPLARGEFFASIRFLAERWQWGKNVVARWIEAAQKAGRLTVQREGQYGTVYLIVNYERYQITEPKSGTSEGTEAGTPAVQERDSSGTKQKQ